MKEVYVVLGQWNYDTAEVIRVCSSRKAAEHVMDNNKAGYDQIFIQKHEVEEDKPIDPCSILWDF